MSNVFDRLPDDTHGIRVSPTPDGHWYAVLGEPSTYIEQTRLKQEDQA